MTQVGGLGIALVYEFVSGERMFVRVCELLPMRGVIEYMARKHNGIKSVSEPGGAPRRISAPITTAATVIERLIAARIATPVEEEHSDAAAD